MIKPTYGVCVSLLLALSGCSDPLVIPDSSTHDTVEVDNPTTDFGPARDVVEADLVAQDVQQNGTDVVTADRMEPPIDAPFQPDGSCVATPPPPMQPISPTLMPERRVTCGCRIAAPQLTAGAADRYLLRGRIVTPTEVYADGEVLIVRDRFQCVGPAGMCAMRPEANGATVYVTGGVIYPGLIDAHNHVAYNWLPEWVPPRQYANRYQWAGAAAYSTFITPYRTNSGMHECAMAKYGEARAIFAGTTTIQGGPNRICTRVLARNPEFGADFGGVDTHATNILGISTVDAMAAANLRAQMDSNRLTTYIIHLAEGVDDSSRAEFADLRTKNLLTQATVLVHGTALMDAHHTEVGTARARLVWSPRSNIALYGGTTDIRSALAHGVPVALAPDWTPSGAPDVLQELRYARNLARQMWPNLLSDRALVEMVTSRAAAVLGRGTDIGAIAVGRYADVMVVPDWGCDPYSTLIDAPTADVEMVFVGGKPLYGRADLMRALPAAAQTACESTTICGTERVACVARPGAGDMMDQTLAQITSEIQAFYPMPLPLVPRCPQ
jgi:cytosine/adenosine deaminase-related metal-dependent hydrolase